MELQTFKALMHELNACEVRYLLAGGMAVVAHGYGRMTFDIDLVIQLESSNIRRAFEAFEALGYHPRIPVTGKEFALAGNWECDWKDDRLFHLRYFKALSMTEKIRAVEEMCKTAAALEKENKK